MPIPNVSSVAVNQPSNVGAAAGPLAPRRFTRNPLVEPHRAHLASNSQNGGASESVIHAANATLKKWAFNYHTGQCKKASVEVPPSLDASGKRIIDLTVLCNVSGHVGAENAARFAQSNKYVIKVTQPDGQALWMRGIDRKQPVEYCTAQDISFELMKGTTVIEAWPEGSAGVGGYVEGRRYELHFGDTPFQPDATGQDPSDKNSRFPFPEP